MSAQHDEVQNKSIKKQMFKQNVTRTTVQWIFSNLYSLTHTFIPINPNKCTVKPFLFSRYAGPFVLRCEGARRPKSSTVPASRNEIKLPQCSFVWSPELMLTGLGGGVFTLHLRPKFSVFLQSKVEEKKTSMINVKVHWHYIKPGSFPRPVN